MTIIESEKIASNVKTVFWYLRRPRLYRDLIRKTISRLHHRQSVAATRQEAEDWAEKHAMNTAEAIMLISGAPMPESVKDRYKKMYSHMQKRLPENVPSRWAGREIWICFIGSQSI